MIKIVIFDGNGVLYDVSGAAKLFYSKMKEFLKRHKPNGATLEEILDRESRIWRDLDDATKRGKLSMRDAHLKVFEELGIPTGLIDEYEEMDRKAFATTVLTEPDVPEALRHIKKMGTHTALLSDSARPSAELKPLLEKLGIAQYIDGIFVSSEIGYEKPEKEAYEAVLKKFVAAPADSVFVGHDKEELAGARMLGIRTISYRGDPICDCVAQNFKQVESCIKGIL